MQEVNVLLPIRIDDVLRRVSLIHVQKRLESSNAFRVLIDTGDNSWVVCSMIASTASLKYCASQLYPVKYLDKASHV